MHAVFIVYNFVNIHQPIETKPAKEAGETDFLWSMADIVLMSETMRSQAGFRGRPPSCPFLREESAFRSDRTAPPALPI